MALLVWRLGTGPFVDGLRTVDATAVLAGLLIGVPTTLCCAWRWSLVAHRRGVGLTLREAVVSYYRSQFLNSTLPGGVLGDVHRATRHGLRPVALERLTGQGVQLALTALALLLLPAPIHLPAAGPGGDLRPGSGSCSCTGRCSCWPRRWRSPATSLTFVVAARTSGVDASLSRLLPLALVVLVAMSIPANVAGWGPREGVAAWAFAASGLGASAGIATAVVYGVMSLVATLPGRVLLTIVVGSRAPTIAKEPVHA